jgi:uncharacterized protein
MPYRSVSPLEHPIMTPPPSAPSLPAQTINDADAVAAKPAGPRTKRPRPRQEVRQIKERASYERTAAYAILDAGFIGHVGFAIDGQPFVIPMLYVRDGDSLLLHGGVASRLMRELAGGVECCVSVTHVDGLVLARSHFHHSVNYRSVVAFGRATAVSDDALKAAILHRYVNALIPGRAADARPADRKELGATTLLKLDIVDISAKTRDGDPKDHPDDLALPVWAGILPVAQSFGTPRASADLAAAVALPDYLHHRTDAGTG